MSFPACGTFFAGVGEFSVVTTMQVFFADLKLLEGKKFFEYLLNSVCENKKSRERWMFFFFSDQINRYFTSRFTARYSRPAWHSTFTGSYILPKRVQCQMFPACLQATTQFTHLGYEDTNLFYFMNAINICVLHQVRVGLLIGMDEINRVLIKVCFLLCEARGS